MISKRHETLISYRDFRTGHYGYEPALVLIFKAVKNFDINVETGIWHPLKGPCQEKTPLQRKK